MPRPEDRLPDMREGEAFFLAQLVALDDDAFTEPCGLPGWTRAHVAAHVARNADALGNLLTWARTGVETPMYVSPEQRAKDTEAGAALPPAELRADVEAASARLVDAVDALPDEAWDAPVRTARGRAITAADVPWIRTRESWVHAVDLGPDTSFAALPPSLLVDLVDDVASLLVDREDCPAILVVDVDSSRSWRIGTGHDPVEVHRPAAELLAWLIGREADDALPAVPAWY